MKMENSTQKITKQARILMRLSLVWVLAMILSNVSYGQCVLACNNDVQVSLDGACEAEITFDMVLEDPNLLDPDCYTVEVLTLNDVLIPTSPIVTGSFIGQTLKVRVLNSENNSCWGLIHIEDKLRPILNCFEDITVSCNEEPLGLNFLASTNARYAAEISEENPATTANGLSFTSFPLPISTSQLADLIVPITVDNEASQFEYIESMTLNFSVLGIVSAESFNITLLSPDGSINAWQITAPGSGNFSIDIPQAVGLQTTDAFINGVWLFQIYSMGTEASAQGLQSAEFSIVSRGLELSPFGHNENCADLIDYTLLLDDVDDLNCNQEFSAVRTISYKGTDSSGNMSDPCSFTITYERRDTGDIVFPIDTVLVCKGYDNNPFPAWDINQNDYPDANVNEAGVPTIDGNPIFPNDGFCEINVTFEDHVIEVCPGEYKVLRKWVALDWCTTDIRTEYQIIKIGPADTELFVICPQDGMEFSADPYSCLGTAILPPPTVGQTCSTIRYQVGFILADEFGDPASQIYTPTGDIFNGDENAIIEGLPLGRSWVQYTVFDECGHLGECFTEVDVVDDTPPYPVCDQFTVVTLTSSGWAHIYADSFDDGSHDNCSDVKFAVRRMSFANCLGSGIPRPDVYITINGVNYYEYEQFCCADAGDSDIMVELLVIDEAGNHNTCMVNVNVQDKLPFVLTCPPDITIDCNEDIDDLSVTGTVNEINDNCGSGTPTYTDEGDLDNCRTGNITRTWSVTIGGETRSCQQRISVRNLTPESYATGPDDEDILGCMNSAPHPDETGFPDYYGDDCSLMASTYEDQIFYFAEDACFKVIRSWTVIDWCWYDQTDGEFGIWKFTQIIKANDFDDPILTCERVEICTYDADCKGAVEITIDVDDCTEESELVYKYRVDNGQTITGSTVTGRYDVGEHIIYWTVEDMCGNKASCEQEFLVDDCKNPTPYCLGGITTVVMNDPAIAEVTIWASDFDLGSFDNCGVRSISFSPDETETNRTYTCDSLGTRQVQIWVTDLSGNQDFCSTMIEIQDNSGVCGEGNDNMALISGRISSEANDNVDNVSVELINSDSFEEDLFITQENGAYAFNEIPMNNNYEISATRNDNYLNGVSTLDLVLIQKHILGLQVLDSPYKIVASDVNNSGSVTAIDLVELRKLILGIYEELPSNDSWRFIDGTQQFTSSGNPWPLDEIIAINNISASMSNNDFVAVKIGDVNASANFNAQQQLQSENRGAPFTFISNDLSYKSGDIVKMDIIAGSDADILGYQYTIDFVKENLDYVDYESGVISLDEANIATNNTENGYITTSWSTAEVTHITKGDKLYTLTFRAKTNNTLSNSVDINSMITKAELYNSQLDAENVVLSYSRSVSPEDNFSVYQNVPNPFSNKTSIGIELGKDTNVKITLMDITGKKVYERTAFYTSGTHNMILNADEIGIRGMIYYTIEADGYAISKKMLIID